MPVQRKLFYLGVAQFVLFLLFAWGTKSHSWLAGADTSVWRFWSEHGVQPLHSIAHAITSLGVVTVLLPVSLVVGAFVYVRVSSIAFALAPFFSVQITATIVSFMKKSINSPRPPVSSHIYPVHNAAFPSGHAADTTALVVITVLLVYLLFPRKRAQTIALSGGITVIVAMALTRLILNVHWMSDVMGGITLGCAVSFLVLALTIRINELLKSL